jgi:hypothetical protein
MATEDWTQRLKENPPDPLEYIRQIHESWLTELEGLAVEAISTNNWDAFYAHLINFQNEHDHHGESGIAIAEKFYCVQLLDTHKRIEASTDSLSAPVLTFSQTKQTI